MKTLEKVSFFFKSLLVSQTALDTYLVLVGNALTIVFSFAFTVLSVRLLSLSDFGKFSTLLAILLLVSEIADFGIGNSLSRFLPKIKDKVSESKDFLKTALFVQIVVVFLLVAFLALISPLAVEVIFRDFYILDLFLVTIFIGISFSTLVNFFQYALASYQRFVHVSILSSSSSFFRLLLLVILIASNTVSLKNVVYIQAGSFIVGGLLGFLFLKKNLLKGKYLNLHMKKLVLFASHLGFARTLSAVTAKLDIVMLMWLSSASETGLYATAVKAVSVYPLISGSFITVIAPKISEIESDDQMISFGKKIALATVGLIFTIVIFMILSEPFMIYFFGEKVVRAVLFLRLLLLAMVFLVASIPAVSIAVYYLHKPSILAVNSIIQVLVVIAGNLFLIPKYGGIGAAVSLNIAYSTTGVLTYLMTYYYYRKRGNL